MRGIVNSMSLMVEMRDLYTAGHQNRVANLASAIADEMHFSDSMIEGIFLAALIHDIGKNSIPADILSKPSRLNKIEFEMVKTHSQIGYDIIKNIEFPWPIPSAVLQHHERINGTGYPSGLYDKDIIIEAKIIGVADVVESMSSYRPYRAAFGIEKALEEILKNKSILYDPAVADACAKIFAENKFKFD
jgi:HD-GYP domain-containing protein (c-di-GMP phosphodiesterase class II)